MKFIIEMILAEIIFLVMLNAGYSGFEAAVGGMGSSYVLVSVIVLFRDFIGKEQ